MASATRTDVEMLKDPMVREESSWPPAPRSWTSSGPGTATAWAAAATGQAGGGGSVPARTGGPSLPTMPAFGQEKLERRVDKLSETVVLLRQATGDDITGPLDGVDNAIDRIRLALAVSANLPLVKRKKSQREIGDALGQLEDAVMNAAMGRP